MNITVPKSWKDGEEKRLEDIDSIYKGYYIDRDGVRYVGFAMVIRSLRGLGYFKHLLNVELKDCVDAIVLISPSNPTRELAERLGYRYDYELHACIWERE